MKKSNLPRAPPGGINKLNIKELRKGVEEAEKEFEKAKGVRALNEQEAENVYNKFSLTQTEIDQIISDWHRSIDNEKEAKGELDELRLKLQEAQKEEREKGDKMEESKVTEERTEAELEIEVLEKRIVELRQESRVQKERKLLENRIEAVRSKAQGWGVKLDKNENFRITVLNSDTNENEELISFHNRAENWLLNFLEHTACLKLDIVNEMIEIAKGIGPPPIGRGRPPKKKEVLDE